MIQEVFWMRRYLAIFTVCFLALFAAVSLTGCGDKDSVSSAAEKEESGVSSSDVSRIVGTWREDGEFGINVLTIAEDGSYVLYHTSGGTQQGKVEIDGDVHSDGTSDSWFSFYDESGELWTGFPNLTENPSELISESADRMKFVRIDENEKTPAKDYLGTWQGGRCSINVSKAKDGYKVNVIWGSSAFESSEWNYNCRYDKETATLICDGGATLVNHKYDEKGKDNKTTVYKDGSGSFKARGGVLRWTDDKEDSGKELYFAHLPDQE